MTEHSLNFLLCLHLKKILAKNNVAVDEKRCNCRDKSSCPVNNECLMSAVVYQATVTSAEGTKEYVGLAEPSFKSRFSNHKSDITHKEKGMKGTTLSKHIWALKDANTQHTVKWEILKQSSPYKCGTRKCDLCLTEKLAIIKGKSEKLLNYVYQACICINTDTQCGYDKYI